MCVWCVLCAVYDKESCILAENSMIEVIPPPGP